MSNADYPMTRIPGTDYPVHLIGRKVEGYHQDDADPDDPISGAPIYAGEVIEESGWGKDDEIRIQTEDGEIYYLTRWRFTDVPEVETTPRVLDVNEDPVSSPSHYTAFGAEVIDITEWLNFNRGNAVKYIARAGLKNAVTEVEDLEKAAWYIARELDRLSREDSSKAARAE